MIGKAREAMKTQQLHQVLNAVWAVVADANRYFAGEAPWALAKTDPARQGTVLYVTAEVIRQVAILAQPFMPASAAKLLDLLAVPAERTRISPRSAAGSRIAAGATLPAPAPVFPRYVEPEASAPRMTAMLVDSHCHLDFPDFADELDAVVARARAAGRRAHRHHLDAGQAARRAARDRRALSRRLSARSAPIRTTPHEELDVTVDELIAPRAPSQGGGDRRGRARLPLRLQPARGAGAGLPHPHRGGARDRPAARHPFARCRRRHGAHPAKRRPGRAPFPAVLHCYTGGRELAARAIALGLYDLVHRHPDLQEVGRAARHRQRACRRTASWSRPTRPISRPAHFAASATSRPIVVETAKVLAETRGVSFDEIARQTTDNFFRLFSKVPRPGRADCAVGAG